MSGIVQQNSGTTTGTSIAVAFNSPVTKGNLLVVGIFAPSANPMRDSSMRVGRGHRHGATFEIDGQKHQAGIRRGRRVDVADDTDQINVQLRVREDAFDVDTFIPEAKVADIVKAVSEKFEKGEYWKLS